MSAIHVKREGTIENKIQEFSGKGESPIRSLLLIGHGIANSTSMGSLDPRGLTTNAGTLDYNFQWSSYDDAIQSHLSRGFYFTVNATIRAVGCHTNKYAESVAANLLRGKDATSFGTNAFTWVGDRPKVMGWSENGIEVIESTKVKTAQEFFAAADRWTKFNGPGR